MSDMCEIVFLKAGVQKFTSNYGSLEQYKIISPLDFNPLGSNSLDSNFHHSIIQIVLASGLFESLWILLVSLLSGETTILPQLNPPPGLPTFRIRLEAIHFFGENFLLRFFLLEVNSKNNILLFV